MKVQVLFTHTLIIKYLNNMFLWEKKKAYSGFCSYMYTVNINDTEDHTSNHIPSTKYSGSLEVKSFFSVQQSI